MIGTALVRTHHPPLMRPPVDGHTLAGREILDVCRHTERRWASGPLLPQKDRLAVANGSRFHAAGLPASTRIKLTCSRDATAPSAAAAASGVVLSVTAHRTRPRWRSLGAPSRHTKGTTSAAMKKGHLHSAQDCANRAWGAAATLGTFRRLTQAAGPAAENE